MLVHITYLHLYLETNETHLKVSILRQWSSALGLRDPLPLHVLEVSLLQHT